MYRSIYILVFLGVTSNGDSGQDDWRNQGFYRPRRNYASQSQNQNSQNTFGNSFSLNNTPQSNVFGEKVKSTFGAGFIPYQTQNQFGALNQPKPQNAFINAQNHFLGTGFNSKSQTENAFGITSAQNAKNTTNNQLNQRQNAFGLNYQRSQSQNIQKQDYLTGSTAQNGFGTSFSQPNSNVHRQNQFVYNQQPQSQNYLIPQRQTFGSRFGQNPFQQQNAAQSFGTHTFKGQEYLPPPSRPPFKGPDYLPPRDDSATTRQPFFTQSTSRPSTTTIRPYYSTTTTRRPFYTTTTTRRPFYSTATRRPFYTTTTRRPFYTTTTRRPFYTTTTRRPFYTTTTSRPYYTPTTGRTYTTTSQRTTSYKSEPAMAMSIPPEPKDESTTPETTGRLDLEFNQTPIPITTVPSTRPTPKLTEGGRVLPAMAMSLPPEPIDEPTTPETTGRLDLEFNQTPIPITTVPSTRPTPKLTEGGRVLPAMAMSLPPEPIDEPTTPETTGRLDLEVTITTTTPAPSTPSTTIGTTLDLNRFREDPTTTTKRTTTTTTTSRPFIAPGYLPPVDERPTPQTVPDPKVAPAMAMSLPPEPIDEPTTPETTGRLDLEVTTTTSTPAPTTPSTTIGTTPELNRFREVPTTTTKRTTTTTTTSRPFIAPGYLPPVDERPTPQTVPDPKVAPAMAMSLPPEPIDDPTTPETTGRLDLEVTTTTSTPAPTTPSTTIGTTPELNRFREDTTTTTKRTTTTTTTSRPFIAPGYLPPVDERPTPQTVPDPKVAPAMAMSLPPEPIDDPTTPETTGRLDLEVTTTTSTPAPTTPSTTIGTTPELNRFREDTTTTTKRTTTTTTTSRPFIAPGYLPPVDERPTPQTVPDPKVAPAMAMSLPPEPIDEPTTPETTGRLDLEVTTTTTTTPAPTTTTTTTPAPTTPSTTTTDPNRFIPPPKPAMAVPVPPEPKCNTNDPYPFDNGERSGDPCGSVISTTKPPYVGPAYLPPAPKKRVTRSPRTLTLKDLVGVKEGYVRPVWHIVIYAKNSRPYKQICGGSMVRNDVVLSAAHCFWGDGKVKNSANDYAVAGHKSYKPWGEKADTKAQKSDVSEIIIPPRYRGVQTSHQDDLAILRLVTAFTYERFFRPLCVSFDDGLEEEQLVDGTNGTIAGFGLTDATGSETQEILWLELPYVAIEICISKFDEFDLKYITSDKICAGEFGTGKALCRGDSGGGLVFWYGEPNDAVPYLRGVASTAPKDGQQCNVNTAGGFTQVSAHRRFLTKHVPDIENCRYKNWK